MDSGAGGFSIVSRAVDPTNGWTAADLAAAATFHTEMALRLAKVSRQPDRVAHVEAATALLRAALDRGYAR